MLNKLHNEMHRLHSSQLANLSLCQSLNLHCYTDDKDAALVEENVYTCAGL